MKVNIVGIDPGVIDTAVVSLTLDLSEKCYWIRHHVWTGVTRRENKVIIVDQQFLHDLKVFVIHEANWATQLDQIGVYIENFQQRGRDIMQDQRMLALVREIKRALPKADIIDNTSVKKLVTEATLDAFNMRKFQVPTNHQDLKSAARILLMGMIKSSDKQNELVADFIRDHIEGERWNHVSTSTL